MQKKKAIETYELMRAASYGLKVCSSSSSGVSSRRDLSTFEVPESATSSLFRLFVGEAAEGRECVDSVASDSISLSEEVADL
jgi:hypothetical protein